MVPVFNLTDHLFIISSGCEAFLPLEIVVYNISRSITDFLGLSSSKAAGAENRSPSSSVPRCVVIEPHAANRLCILCLKRTASRGACPPASLSK